MTAPDRIAALEERVRLLEDREAITALIYRYAQCIRRRDPAACRKLLVDDAVFELRHILPEGVGDVLVHRIEGGDAIVGVRDDEAGANAVMWPMIHAVQIAVDGDEATSLCLTETAIWPFGKQFIGEYADRFVRTASGWRFAERVYRLYGEASGVLAEQSRAEHQAEKY